LENNAAKASRALGVFSLRFFNHSRGASKGERAAFGLLPRGFLALRACRNCSCRGESFLINLAFINLPSNSLVQRNGIPMGVLHKLEKIVSRCASMRQGINSTQKLLTLDFPTLPSLTDWLAVVGAEDLWGNESNMPKQKHRDQFTMTRSDNTLGKHFLIQRLTLFNHPDDRALGVRGGYYWRLEIFQAPRRKQARPDRGGFSSLEGVEESNPGKRSGEGKKFR